MTDAGLDWQQEAVFFCQLPLPLGLLYPVNQPKLVIEKPGGPLPLPQLPQDDGEVPAVKQAAREKAPLGDSITDDHQKEDAGTEKHAHQNRLQILFAFVAAPAIAYAYIPWVTKLLYSRLIVGDRNTITLKHRVFSGEC